MSAVPKGHYTLAQYIELDKNSDERYEFIDGEVVAMSGASLNHNRITSNVISSLRNKLEGRPCEVLPADMRINVPKAPPYRYADVVVVCGDPLIERIDGLETLVNPVLIVEVLSSNTEAYDRGQKFNAYQSIESFHEYLLVAQDRPYITQYLKQVEGTWLRSDIEGINRGVEIESLGLTLPLKEVYRLVEFSPLKM